MIGVLTFLRAKPDRLIQLIDMLQGVIAPSLDNPSCLEMHLHADPDDSCRLMIYEQWLSKTDFDVNGALPQSQWLWQHRMDYLQDDIKTHFFDLVSITRQTDSINI
jgi:quinol monooxygenase YgiN